MKTIKFFATFFMVLTLSQCANAQINPNNPPPLNPVELSEHLELVEAFPELQFPNLVQLLQIPGDNSKFFAVQQNGLVEIFDNQLQNQSRSVFADLRSIVPSSRGEMGLLSMAFAPDFSDSHDVYFCYTLTQPVRLLISKGKFNPETKEVDTENLETILSISKIEFDGGRFTNHNGGLIMFGPDNYLYVGVGDSGGNNDQFRNGQNLSTLWGSILRIDVLHQNATYSIPADNPFLSQSNAREEIYAYGLRNPWRFSFDRLTGELFAADVGQNSIEEINVIKKGGNYGWNIFEGSQDFNNPSQLPLSDFEAPIWEYNHRVGRSITGGYVYRGQSIPALNGFYVYGDYVAGKVWALELDIHNQAISNQEIGRASAISSFAEDQEGELYVISRGRGQIFKIQAKAN